MNKCLLLCFFFLGSFLYAQTETVVIKKATAALYRGTQKETESWYLLIDMDNNYYLAKVERPVEEVYDWFTRFKNSQNIYKSGLVTSTANGGFGANNQYTTLHFRKENEPADILNFYLEKPDKNTVVLISLDDNSTFVLTLIQP